MNFEITRRGVHGADGKRIPIGTVIEVEGDKVPGWLTNKGHPVASQTVAVTNPAEGAMQQPLASGAERQELLKLAAIEIGDDAFLADGRPDVRAVNDELIDGVSPFSAEERDQLWPGIADAVKAARKAG